MAGETHKKIDLFAVNKDIIQLYKKYFVPLLYFGLIISLLSFFVDKIHRGFLSFFSSSLVDILTMIGSAILLWYINHNEQGKKINMTKAFSESNPRFLTFVLTSILVKIITIVGVILLVIPGIIWGLMFSQTTLFVLLKNYRVRQALSASRKLTKGHRWFLFRMYAQLLIISVLFYGLVSMLSTLLGHIHAAIVPIFGNIFSTVGQMLLMSLVVVFNYAIWRALNKAKTAEA